jgi:hypothetical protein
MHRRVVKVQLYALLMPMLYGNELSAYDLLYATHTPWTGSREGPTLAAKRKIPAPLGTKQLSPSLSPGSLLTDLPLLIKITMTSHNSVLHLTMLLSDISFTGYVQLKMLCVIHFKGHAVA